MLSSSITLNPRQLLLPVFVLMVPFLAACNGSSGGSDPSVLFSETGEGLDNSRTGTVLSGGIILPEGSKLDIDGEVTKLTGINYSTGTTNGNLDEARFNNPVGLTTDGKSLFVADSLNHNIRKIEFTNKRVTTLAGAPWGSSGLDDGIGYEARFNRPTGITTDGVYLYVTDTDNHTIRRVGISSEKVKTIAGMAGVPGLVDDKKRKAQFSSPAGITTDGKFLYVADTGNHVIRKINIGTGKVTTLAGSGVIGSTDAKGDKAEFNKPTGIVTDGTNLYVADMGNHTIRQIVIQNGKVTTLAGLAGNTGSVDDIGEDARFDEPYHLTTDGKFLYVTESNSYIVRKVNINKAEVTTLAGWAYSSGTSDGLGEDARFEEPAGITSDGESLFVADQSAHTIRQID